MKSSEFNEEYERLAGNLWDGYYFWAPSEDTARPSERPCYLDKDGEIRVVFGFSDGKVYGRPGSMFTNSSLHKYSKFNSIEECIATINGLIALSK